MGAPSRAPERRSYNSPVRRQRAAATRSRIVAAGVDVVHSLSEWDWSGLTFRAVAETAGVSESTVYRHFANERELHGAVMERLHEQAGVEYSSVRLDTVAEFGAQVFTSMATFAAASPGVTVTDPTISQIDRVRRTGLQNAVSSELPGLADDERDAVAGVLDVLWSPTAYERLVTEWGLSREQATEAIEWAIGLVVTAVRSTTANDRK